MLGCPRGPFGYSAAGVLPIITELEHSVEAILTIGAVTSGVFYIPVSIEDISLEALTRALKANHGKSTSPDMSPSV
jgi:hypothetical protein